MTELHHLKRLILSRYRQFRFFEIDLIDPEDGEEVRELCLIGPNGSGKSTLLAELYRSLNPAFTPLLTSDDLVDALVLAKYTTDGEDLYLARSPLAASGDSLAFDTAIEQSEEWDKLSAHPLSFAQFIDIFADYRLEKAPLTMRPGRAATWFSSCLSLVDNASADESGPFIQKSTRDREDAYFCFLTEPENRNQTLAELEKKFESLYPNFLTGLDMIRSAILKPSSHFSVFALETGDDFITTDAGSVVPFSHLSPVLQDLIFRIGRVHAQYLGHKNREGSLFLDGPEEGLHPKLAQRVMNVYRSILRDQNAPLFVATHNPHIAAQFPPASRLRLKLGEDGAVTVTQGIAPTGADPNQILRSDFEVEIEAEAEVEIGTVAEVETQSETGAELESETGAELESDAEAASENLSPPSAADPSGRYSQLKRAIRVSDDQDELADLIDEVITMRKY